MVDGATIYFPEREELYQFHPHCGAVFLLQDWYIIIVPTKINIAKIFIQN